MLDYLLATYKKPLVRYRFDSLPHFCWIFFALYSYHVSSNWICLFEGFPYQRNCNGRRCWIIHEWNVSDCDWEHCMTYSFTIEMNITFALFCLILTKMKLIGFQINFKYFVFTFSNVFLKSKKNVLIRQYNLFCSCFVQSLEYVIAKIGIFA